MKIQNIIEGLQIIQKYSEEEYCVNADHDIIYAGDASETKMPTEEQERLKELGWRCDEQAVGWYAFV